MASLTDDLLPWASRAVRAGVYLVLGGIIAAGYVVLASGLVQLAQAAPDVPPALTIALTVIAVPLALTPPLLAPVRDLEIAAVRGLLDVHVLTPTSAPGWDDRLRAAGYVLAHLVTGAGAVVALLFGVPYAVGLLGWALGARGDGFQLSAPDLGLWGVPLGLAVLAALPMLALVGARQLRTLALALLGPSATERELAERRRAVVLAERNRIARDLHDGVGHALAVTTMQASVAEAALGADEDAARAALAEIGRVGRQAMADLDRSLAVLRSDDDEATATAPAARLDDLDALRRHADAVGQELLTDGDVADLAELDALTSREAHRLLAEAVVNARRHGTGPATMRWRRTPDALALELRNAVGPSWIGAGGRGLVGMRERAALIGADLDAGRDGDDWRVRLRIEVSR